MCNSTCNSTPREAARIFAATAQSIEDAALRLRAGALVALPTETVYGLGANALDGTAVARIFEAKGRPATNPLIVHVADIAGARRVVREWTAEAQLLAETFWPGPLTLVLGRGDEVPRIVTAGLDAVGVRVPAHPVALQVLESAKVPIAAPSANRSEEVSPTTALHVRQSLGAFLSERDMILDGGACRVGIESSVLDLTQRPPVLLRPGGTSRASIERIIGPIRVLGETGHASTPLPSPGQMARHYAPRARAVRFQSRAAILKALHEATHDAPKYLGLLLIGSSVGPLADSIMQRVMPGEAQLYAREMYAVLRELDETDRHEIWIEMPPESEEWRAVRDRIERATVEK